MIEFQGRMGDGSPVPSPAGQKAFDWARPLATAARVVYPTQEVPHKQIKKVVRNVAAAWRAPELFDDELQERRLRRLLAGFKGRSVAVVGNAASLLEAGAGEEIDNHDRVVRFNWGFVSNPGSQGRRTSLHVIASDVPAAEIRAAWPMADIMFVSPLRYYLDPELHGRCHVLPVERWARLVAELSGARPSAGLLTLDLLREADVAKLTVYGFDWKKSRTFYHSALRTNWHAWDRERALVTEWIEQDRRISIHSA